MSDSLEFIINKPSIKVVLPTGSYLKSIKYTSTLYQKNKNKLFNILNYKISIFLEKKAILYSMNGRSCYSFISYNVDSVYDGNSITESDAFSNIFVAKRQSINNDKLSESKLSDDFLEKYSYVTDLMDCIYYDLISIYNPLGYIIYNKESTTFHNSISWYISWT